MKEDNKSEIITNHTNEILKTGQPILETIAQYCGIPLDVLISTQSKLHDAMKQHIHPNKFIPLVNESITTLKELNKTLELDRLMFSITASYQDETKVQLREGSLKTRDRSEEVIISPDGFTIKLPGFYLILFIDNGNISELTVADVHNILPAPMVEMSNADPTHDFRSHYRLGNGEDNQDFISMLYSKNLGTEVYYDDDGNVSNILTHFQEKNNRYFIVYDKNFHPILVNINGKKESLPDILCPNFDLNEDVFTIERNSTSYNFPSHINPKDWLKSINEYLKTSLKKTI